MSKELLASKVVFYDSNVGIPEGYSAPTAISCIVGVTEKGPIGDPIECNSWPEWVQTFGGFNLNSKCAESAYTFFSTGGKRLITIRTCHYGDISIPSSYTALKASGDIEATTAIAQPASVISAFTEPYNMTVGSNLLLHVDGAAQPMVTFIGTPAFVDSTNPEPYALNVGDAITIALNGGTAQTYTLIGPDISAPGAMTQAELINVINREFSDLKSYLSGPGILRIETDLKGSDASIEVSGSIATVVGFPAGVVSSIGSNVGNINGVTNAEIKTIIEGAVPVVNVSALATGECVIETVSTGLAASIQIDAGSSAAPELGFDTVIHLGSDSGSQVVINVESLYEGSYGNNLSFEVVDASSLVADEFNLEVLEGGFVVERFPNLSMDSSADNYFVTQINDGSNMIQVTDPGIGDRPTNGVHGPLTGGDDGLVGITDNDYVGDQTAQTGLYGFDKINIVNLIAIPGNTSGVVQRALINYCDNSRAGLPLAILVTPEGSSAQEAVTHVEDENLLGLSDCGAIYWPWPKIDNPDQNIYGTSTSVVVSSEGLVMGRCAMVDVQTIGGVYQSPAGLIYGTLNMVTGLDNEESLEEPKRDLVYPKRINPITTMEGEPYFIDGSRTLKESSLYPSIGEKRGRSHIEIELKRLVEYVRHLRTTKETRQSAERICWRYLKTQCDLGAFTSKNPAEAFSVDAGEGLNPPSEELAGRLWIEIKFRMAGAYDWVIIKIAKNILKG